MCGQMQKNPQLMMVKTDTTSQRQVQPTNSEVTWSSLLKYCHCEKVGDSVSAALPYLDMRTEQNQVWCSEHVGG